MLAVSFGPPSSTPPSPWKGVVSQLMSVIKENQGLEGQPLEVLLPISAPLPGRCWESQEGAGLCKAVAGRREAACGQRICMRPGVAFPPKIQDQLGMTDRLSQP